MSRSDCSNCFQPRVEVNNPGLKANLRSFNGLPNSQRADIKKILELAERDIADYSAEIQQKQSKLERLEIYTQQLSSLLSPIRCLPNELLLLTFAFCCEENDLRDHKPGNALALSSVCALWRDLAISHSILWSNITVSLRSGSITHEGEHTRDLEFAAFVSLYLQRSKQHPLTLDITLEAGPLAPGFEHPALSLIIKEARRWHHLVQRGHGFGICMPTALGVPILESVTSAGDAVDYAEIDLLTLAPKIKRASFQAGPVDVDNDIEKFSRQWSLLSDLDFIVDVEYTAIWMLLDHCPNLYHLTLRTTGDEHDEQRRSDSLRVLPLRSLSILIEGYPRTMEDPLECLLASFTSPHLTNLVLQHKNTPSLAARTKQFKAIVDFLDRSKCPLTSLTLNGLCLNDKELVTILLRLPSLQELHLEDLQSAFSQYRPISKSFIQTLHAWRRSSIYGLVEPLLPALRSLTLKVKSFDFDPSFFVDAVMSRWTPRESRVQNDLVCLRSVELHLPEAVDAKPYHALLPLEKAGMRIVVKCQGRDGYLV